MVFELGHPELRLDFTFVIARSEATWQSLLPKMHALRFSRQSVRRQPQKSRKRGSAIFFDNEKGGFTP
jgi:hypothetical protein